MAQRFGITLLFYIILVQKLNGITLIFWIYILSRKKEKKSNAAWTTFNAIQMAKHKTVPLAKCQHD